MRWTRGVELSLGVKGAGYRGSVLVATQFDSFDCPRRFLIRPNCSMPWRDVVRFYAGIFIVSMGIAIAFAMKGAWLILPFAGLEMLVVGIALYVVAQRAASWQEIAIDADSIRVVDHSAKRVQKLSFQRAWVRVVLKEAAISGHPSRLLLGSHGRNVEIGNCLNEEEKRHLVVELRRAVQRRAVQI